MRPMASFTLLFTTFLFSIFYFFNGFYHATIEQLSYFKPVPLPDFSQYNTLVSTLPEEDWDTRQGRIIVVGDIHGMMHPLQELLSDLEYKHSTDTLIHVGDIITKGAHTGSLDILSFMTAHNITGVRGNHDQKVLEWREWIEWITGLHGGGKWLRSLRKDWSEAQAQDSDVDLKQWLKRKRRRSGDKKWWKRIPKQWTLFSEHFMIADDMSAEHYRYLLELPLVLHVPSAHAFVVHAGILPSDPTRRLSHPKQPLAHVPKVPKASSIGRHDVQLLRELQEAAVLSVVPQNNDPWTLMNMRSISRHGEVMRDGKAGQPWFTYWNDVVDRCDGFRPGKHLGSSGQSIDPLPCYPSTVIYGHSAARGVDPQRWSIGLDSGCVYGRRLTALVLGKPAKDEIETLRRARRIQFGDKGHGRLYSIKCH